MKAKKKQKSTNVSTDPGDVSGIENQSEILQARDTTRDSSEEVTVRTKPISSNTKDEATANEGMFEYYTFHHECLRNFV